MVGLCREVLVYRSESSRMILCGWVGFIRDMVLEDLWCFLKFCDGVGVVECVYVLRRVF